MVTMIKIRLTGTRDELTRAISLTREVYNVVSKSKAHKEKPDSLAWSIRINAEIKPTDAIPALTMTSAVPDEQAEHKLDDLIEARMGDEGKSQS
jgi:hypothetical protein